MIHPIKGKSHLVVKRDGRIEPFSDKKLLRVVTWATDGSMAYAKTLLEAVDIKLYDKVRSEDLFDEVISTAANLISDIVPTWEKVAKNLYELKLHKEMGVLRSDYPDYEELVQKNVAHGIYDAAVIQQVDIPKLKEAINPAYDSLFTFGGLNVFVSKYCARVKGKLGELPQHTYMRIAIQLMYKDGTEAIIAKYNQLANHEVTEATPKMVNSLRPSAALFSCCLVRPSDSLEGINEAINMLAKESKFSGGCAFDSSLLRSAGSIVAGNLGRSSGSIPYIQALQWVIAGYNQGSVRSSACIDTFSAYHYESPKIAQLKRESGKDEDRARRLQYSVKWNSHLSDAVLNNEDIYLFNPHKTQDLFESYGQQWRTLYQKYSRSHVTKQKYNARELAYIFATTAFDTGNLYFFFDDNANEQDIGAGYIPASNLCQEMVMSYEPIRMVTTKLQDNSSVVEFTGDMALCNLASINLAKWVKFTPEEKEQKMYLLVKSTDNAIENSYYVNPLGKKHSLLHRNIGIGTSNYANILASNKLLWNSEEARKYTHELYEELSYYAIKASVELAKETARCPIFFETKWAKGVFPHELSKLSREKPELTYPLRMDWEPLRKDLLRYGIRNSRLLAIAPTSTSGKTINATEGVDPPRKLKSIQEGTYSLPFVVPDLALYRDYYQTTFEISNKDVIELAAIRQRFLCMSQSVSLAYTSSKSAHELIENVIYAERLGLKTLYYTHTRKANEDGEHHENCESCSS